MTTVCEAIARTIAHECPGTPVFSLIGDANLRIVGALDRYTDALQCFARDEGAAVAMADGYAQASARLGIATVTSGPGLTHAATSLLGASRIRTPLVVIAGDTPMRRPTGIQDMQSFDQRRFVESCEAHFQALRSPLSLADDIASAFYCARAERLPVVLSVPLDLQSADVADDWAAHPPATEPDWPEPGPRAVRTILDILHNAKRPLIIAGRGAIRSHARDDIIGFGDKIGALFGNTLLAKGLFDTSAWTIGVVGGFSSPAAMELIREADAIIAFGAEMGHFTTQGGSLLQGRRVVRVDVAPFAKAALQDMTEIRADAKATAAALCLALQGKTRTGFRTADTRVRVSAPEATSGPRITGDRIDPRQLMRDLGPALPEDTHVVVGGGHFWSFPCVYLAQPKRGSFFCPLGAAAVGQALPFGVGVSMADTRRPVVVIEGDGSLLMNIQELDTAARHRLPIIMIIMNDGALTAEVTKLKALGYNQDLAVYPSPDFCAIAGGFGWKAMTLKRGGEIAHIVACHAWHDRPLLIDAQIARDITFDAVSLKDLARR
jgi:acetolactate synthase I/II/III large subunit